LVFNEISCSEIIKKYLNISKNELINESNSESSVALNESNENININDISQYLHDYLTDSNNALRLPVEISPKGLLNDYMTMFNLLHQLLLTNNRIWIDFFMKTFNLTKSQILVNRFILNNPIRNLIELYLTKYFKDNKLVDDKSIINELDEGESDDSFYDDNDDLLRNDFKYYVHPQLKDHSRTDLENWYFWLN